MASGLQPGCSLFSTVGELPALASIRSHIDDIKLKADQKLPKPDIDRFNKCMIPLSARIKPGFIALASQAKTLKNDIDYDLAARISELDDIDLFHDSSILGRLLAHLPNAVNLESSGTDATTHQQSALAEFSATFLKRFREKFEQGSNEFQNDTKEALDLSKDYLTAYFKKGARQVVAEELSNPEATGKLLEEVGKLLNRKADDPALTKAADIINPQLSKAGQKIARKGSGFVGRDGTQYGFPGVLDQSSPVSIDHNQIGADSIRIILEALRDTYAPLPMLASSTAAENAKLADYVIDFDAHGNLKREADAQEHKYRVDPDGQVRLLWHYDHRDPSKVEAIAITEKRFQTIEAHARKAEAQVAGKVGKAIRGGSWGALNNEAIAKLVETAAGVLARHAVERGEWCILAQDDLIHKN
ncbi:MAG: hypothetical protein ACU836_05745 [Gammaproteobacteria bacterium]